MGTALGSMASTVKNMTSDTDALTEGFDDLANSAEDIKNALGDIKDILEDLSNEDSAEFVKLGDDFKEESENLFDSLSFISDNLSCLGDTFSNDKEKINKDLTNINRYFNSAVNILIGEIEDFENGSHSLEDLFIDVSDSEIESAKQGKTDDCRNFAAVSADRNAGGIAGALAIEFSKDPEDDSESPSTLNFTYQSRAVLYECINTGKITSKKDCGGGIVGLCEIGTVYKCQNYADVESTSGSYSGGIVGKSSSSVRKCCSKASVSGKRYVGGIAGKGDTLTSCYAIVTVKGDENLGAICGYSESREKAANNFFVMKKIGGIDNISYSGKAEPISFDELRALPSVPARFISFTVTFTAEGKTVFEEEVEYGENFSSLTLPNPPAKKDRFGKWLSPENDIITQDIEVTCEYRPYITLISSEEKNKSGKLALALSEGRFTDDAVMHVNERKGLSDDEKIYDITLLNTDIKDNASVNVRILNENKDNVTAWVLKDGKREKTKAVRKGKYVVLTAVGSRSSFVLKYQKKNRALLFSLLSILIIALIICFTKIKRLRTQGKKALGFLLKRLKK